MIFDTISALVSSDYDGTEGVTARDARATLETWRRNDADAKALIDGLGMDAAVTEYVAAWTAAHRDEYDLDSEDA